MSEIQSLTLRVRDLNDSVDSWNQLMIWGLALAAIAAVFVVIATRIVVTRAGQLSTTQELLSAAKDRQLALDLKDKDDKIAQANLDRARIEESIAWRRLTREQQSAFGSNLKRLGSHSVSFWYGPGDKEAETFAMELAMAAYGAQWKVFKPASILELAQAGLPSTESSQGSETGVSVSGPANDAGHALSDAIILELKTRGFDAFRQADSQGPKPDDDVVRIEVKVRPEGPQGEAKLSVAKLKP